MTVSIVYFILNIKGMMNILNYVISFLPLILIHTTKYHYLQNQASYGFLHARDISYQYMAKPGV